MTSNASGLKKPDLKKDLLDYVPICKNKECYTCPKCAVKWAEYMEKLERDIRNATIQEVNKIIFDLEHSGCVENRHPAFQYCCQEIKKKLETQK